LNSIPVEVPAFVVVPGVQVQSALEAKALTSVVENAYRLHGSGDTVNPPSYFLRFDDRPNARIIALPASLGGTEPVDGMKWISSFPDNLEKGIPRASAVLVLNDPETGYPLACMESSIISAARTAASAVLAAEVLSKDRSRPAKVGFLGAGLIARYVHQYLVDTGWSFAESGVHDQVPEYAAGFRDYLERSGPGGATTVYETSEELIRASDLVVLTTTAAEPYLDDPSWFDHHPLVLHISLRDLSPEVIESSFNVVDDVEHCLKANTSVHLLEQRLKHRDFLGGTLHDVLIGNLSVPRDETVVFSPFGLGVLDLAVGRYVYGELETAGRLMPIDGFFAELSRHG
jgi:ornithine cyclodeaminase